WRLPVPWHALVTRVAGSVAVGAASLWHATTTGTAAPSQPVAAADLGHPIDLDLTPSGDTPPTTPDTTAPAVLVDAATSTAGDHDPAPGPSWPGTGPGGMHHVVAGDTLWGISAHTLGGNPHRWPEIYTLNRGHTQTNGYALTNPNEIDTGWVLALP